MTPESCMHCFIADAIGAVPSQPSAFVCTKCGLNMAELPKPKKPSEIIQARAEELWQNERTENPMYANALLCKFKAIEEYLDSQAGFPPKA